MPYRKIVALSSEISWTIKASDARRITAPEMKYVRRTTGYTWTDYKTNAQIAKELKITPILVKLLEYKRSWIQHVNRMPRNRLPRVMKYYCPTGRRNHGRPLKRLLDTWDRNGSTSGPTPWQIWWWWWSSEINTRTQMQNFLFCTCHFGGCRCAVWEGIVW